MRSYGNWWLLEVESQFPLKMWPHIGPTIPMSEWAAQSELGGLFFKKRKCRGVWRYILEELGEGVKIHCLMYKFVQE